MFLNLNCFESSSFESEWFVVEAPNELKIVAVKIVAEKPSGDKRKKFTQLTPLRAHFAKLVLKIKLAKNKLITKRTASLANGKSDVQIAHSFFSFSFDHVSSRGCYPVSCILLVSQSKFSRTWFWGLGT